jgi:hypothetical protein
MCGQWPRWTGDWAKYVHESNIWSMLLPAPGRYTWPILFFVSLPSSWSFFLAPKVVMPISFRSSSVRVTNVGRSISWRTKISAYLRVGCYAELKTLNLLTSRGPGSPAGP